MRGGVDGLFEQHGARKRSTDFSKGEKLGIRDHIIVMAFKELWVYLLAYNLIRLLMAQAALLADQIPRQLSFKHTVQIWLA